MKRNEVAFQLASGNHVYLNHNTQTPTFFMYIF